MKNHIVALVMVSLVFYSTGNSSRAQTFSSINELTAYGIQVKIPEKWQVPFAAIGAKALRIQDGQRTVSPKFHAVYLSPKHAYDWGELELVLYEIDARKWLNAMVIRPEKWLPVRGDKLLVYNGSQGEQLIGSMIPFGNASAVKFRVTREIQDIRFVENLYYCSCGDMLLRIQMRSAPDSFSALDITVFEDFKKQFICSKSNK